jgi:hypothetical protein
MFFEIGCQKYKDKIESLEDQIEELNRKQVSNQQLIDAWKMDYDKLRYDKDLKISLLKIQLVKALKSVIEIPDISMYVVEKERYDPWNDERLSGYNAILADRYYYTYSFNDWFDIIKLAFVSVDKAQTRWRTEIGDCDNYSEAMDYIIKTASLNAKLKHQSAIAICHSRTHAYNAVFTHDEILLVEPQNGNVIGKLGETPEPYDTRRVLFIS